MSAPSDWARRHAGATFGLDSRELAHLFDEVRAEVLEAAAIEAERVAATGGGNQWFYQGANAAARAIWLLAKREGGAT